VTEKNFWVLVTSGDVNVLLVSGRLEVEFIVLKNGVDVLFPTDAGFRMPLESTFDREYVGAVQGDIKAVFVPFGILIINPNKGGIVGAGEYM
jgi:hypothetical protein